MMEDGSQTEYSAFDYNEKNRILASFKNARTSLVRNQVLMKSK